MLRRVLLCTLVVLGSGSGQGFAACEGEGPVAVLDCLSAAYETRSAALYDEVLGEQFEFCSGESPCWPRADELKSATRLFASHEILKLTYETEPRIEAGKEPDTWVLRGLDVHLHMAGGDSPEPIDILAKSVELTVRRVTVEGSPRYVIERWFEPKPGEPQ